MSAQAISIGMPKSTSIFRALLWKEWRQQRWLALPLAALPAVLYMMIFLAATVEDRGDVALAVALLATALTPLIVGASVFCGERDDETDEFLRRMPSGGVRVFTLKLLTVWATSAVTLLLLGAAVMALRAEFRWALPRDFLIVYPVVLLFLGTLPAFVSAWARRTLPNILLSLAVAVGATLWHGWIMRMMEMLTRSGASPWQLWTMRLLQGDRRFLSSTAAANLLFVPVGFAFAVFLIGAPILWIWSRAPRSPRANLRTGALMFALLFLLPASPIMAHYAYFTFMASPAEFEWGYDWPSPNGRWVAGRHSYVGWGLHGDRLSVTNVETGRSEWLTKFRKSSAFPRGSWSPSGNRLAWGRGSWLLPLTTKALEESSYRVWISDMASGTSLPLDGLAPDGITLKGVYPWGWVDEDTPMLRGEGRLLFASLKPGGPWRDMEIPKGVYPSCYGSRGAMAIERAYNTKEVGFGVRVSRFAPDLAKPEQLAIHLSPTPVNDSRFTEKISPDGKWAVVQVVDMRGERDAYIFPIELEAVPVRLHFEDKGRLTESEAGVAGFSANSEKLLLRRERELVVFTLADGSRREIPVCYEEAPEDYIALTAISPNGRFAASKIQGPHSSPYFAVTDLQSGETHEIYSPVYGGIQWLDEDWLLLGEYRHGGSFLVHRNGTEFRWLFGDN